MPGPTLKFLKMENDLLSKLTSDLYLLLSGLCVLGSCVEFSKYLWRLFGMRYHTLPILLVMLIDDLSLAQTLHSGDLMNMWTLRSLRLCALRLFPGPYCPPLTQRWFPKSPAQDLVEETFCLLLQAGVCGSPELVSLLLLLSPYTNFPSSMLTFSFCLFIYFDPQHSMA